MEGGLQIALGPTHSRSPRVAGSGPPPAASRRGLIGATKSALRSVTGDADFVLKFDGTHPSSSRGVVTPQCPPRAVPAAEFLTRGDSVRGAAGVLLSPNDVPTCHL